jgi:hypothetical protein
LWVACHSARASASVSNVAKPGIGIGAHRAELEAVEMAPPPPPGDGGTAPAPCRTKPDRRLQS